jgi:hypothetical protein
VRSTTFLFTTLCTSIQNFRENHGQTVAVGRNSCRNATSRRSGAPAPRCMRRTTGPRPHARLPEAGVAPSQCPMPKAAPTPRRLGALAVAWRAPRSTHRGCRACSWSLAVTRPAPRPGRFRDVASVAYKGPDRPRACALESPSPRFATVCHGRRHR